MVVILKNQMPSPRIDPAMFFKKLGLTVADERPIMEAWRKANANWRCQRGQKSRDTPIMLTSTFGDFPIRENRSRLHRRRPEAGPKRYGASNYGGDFAP